MAEEEVEEFLNRERLCPSCRSTINALAVTCRFCGQEIGKPKEEQRELTAQDLGGESVHHRAPSGTVMGALEAFRAEELEAAGLSDGPGADEGIQRGAPPEPGQLSPDGLPILNATSQGLSALSETSFSARAAVKRPPKSFKDRALPIGLAVAGILVVIFAGVKGANALMTYLEEKNRVPEIVFHNRAPGILEAGGPAIEALRAAAEALAVVNNDENRAIGSQALAAIEKEILALLNRSDWSMETIRQAAGLGEFASRAYSHELTTHLKNITREEKNLYSMWLESIDPDGTSATFTLQDGRKLPGVRKGDVIESRFNVVRVTSARVIFEDPLRRSRAGSSREVSFDPVTRTAH